MPTAIEAVAGGDWGMSTPSLDPIPERVCDPEWHSLRLFGRGRRPGAFDAGVETCHEL
jgi:hypothetical protein